MPENASYATGILKHLLHTLKQHAHMSDAFWHSNVFIPVLINNYINVGGKTMGNVPSKKVEKSHITLETQAKSLQKWAGFTLNFMLHFY